MKYYRVTSLPRTIPHHHEYGYESYYDFLKVLLKIVHRNKDLIGECVDSTPALLRLKFTDTGTGQSRIEWIPSFLCKPAVPPRSEECDDEEDPLKGLLGEGW